MCGLQFSVQLPQGGELARDRVDADGTVFVQDGVSEPREQRKVITYHERFLKTCWGKGLISCIDLLLPVRKCSAFALWFMKYNLLFSGKNLHISA